MIVEMLTLAASPVVVLHAGKVYNLPKAQAQEFIKGGYARLAERTQKVERVPPQPDPEDVPELPDEDEVTEEDEE